MTKKHKYATNSILMNRYDIENVVHLETKNNKNQEKIQEKYTRNVFIQHNDRDGVPFAFDFLDEGKKKSHVSYNKKGLPIEEVYSSNYGIGDYTAVSTFQYDVEDNLIRVKTRLDDGTEYVREYVK